MPCKRIFYRAHPRDDVLLWAWRRGTLAEIRRSAEERLEELREEGYRQAVVWIEGERIRVKRQKPQMTQMRKEYVQPSLF